MSFYQWLVTEKKLSQASASKYNLVIQNRIREWLPSYEIPQNSIEFEALKQMILNLDIYKERNSVGNNMYSSALKHYGNYLKEFDQRDTSIFKQDKNFTSEAERKIKVRLVQNKFRKGLFDLYPRCAISGLSHASFLIASHIKPWSISNDQERLDQFNGLLLTPNYDRLFDRGFITIEMSGKILISKSLTQDSIDHFRLPTQLKIDLNDRHEQYLKFHRDKIFQK